MDKSAGRDVKEKDVKKLVEKSVRLIKEASYLYAMKDLAVDEKSVQLIKITSYLSSMKDQGIEPRQRFFNFLLEDTDSRHLLPHYFVSMLHLNERKAFQDLVALMDKALLHDVPYGAQLSRTKKKLLSLQAWNVFAREMFDIYKKVKSIRSNTPLKWDASEHERQQRAIAVLVKDHTYLKVWYNKDFLTSWPDIMRHHCRSCDSGRDFEKYVCTREVMYRCPDCGFLTSCR